MVKNVNYGIAIIVIALGVVASVMASLALMSTHYTQKEIPVNAYDPVFSENKDKRRISGAWVHKCTTEQGKVELCSLSQSVMSEDHVMVLRADVTMIEREGKLVPRLTLSAPLGTFLPMALTLHLPPQEPFSIPFQFCNKGGCLVNLDLSDDVITAMSRTAELHISYISEHRNKQETSLSLNGIAQGIQYLQTQ